MPALGAWAAIVSLWLAACLPQVQPAGTTTTYELPGVTRAVTDEELAELLRENLNQDLLPWLADSRPQGQLTALDFLNLLHEIDTQWPAYRRNFIAIVAIKSNQYSFWTYPTARSWCKRRVRIAGEEFTKYIQSHNLTFPDVMYVMNGYDKPLCLAGNCSAPIFSYGKCWPAAMPSVPCGTPAVPTSPRRTTRRPGSEAPSISSTLNHSHTVSLTEHPLEAATLRNKGRLLRSGSHHHSAQHSLSQPVSNPSSAAHPQSGLRSPHDDILLPVMNHPFDHLLQYPWNQQRQVAFMRAGLYAAMAANCSRVLLYQLAQTPAAKEVLDVGIYQNRHWRVRVKTVPPVPLEEHAQYRFLINTDGQAASWRLAKLLAMRSVILKWRSPQIEHYYRSLKAGVHYLDVDETDVLQTVERLRRPEAQQQLEAMARQAQGFAYRYLSQLSRAAYARSALSKYQALYKRGDMDSLLITLTEQGAPDMRALLQLRLTMLRSARWQ